MTTEESASASPIPSPIRARRRRALTSWTVGVRGPDSGRLQGWTPLEADPSGACQPRGFPLANNNGYHRAVPFWAWIPLFVLLFVAVLLAIVVVLGRVRGGRYLRPIVTFLSKVPLFKRWFQRMSIAALERQNPELASAMKKMQAFGEPKTAEQAQRMLNLLTPTERRAYMEAVGQEAEMPEATNRQLRRRMEHGGAGMPVRAAPVPQRPGSAGRKSKNAKKKR